MVSLPFTLNSGGKAAATGEFDKGADVVYHASGGSRSGVFDAAVDAGEGKWAIGVGEVAQTVFTCGLGFTIGGLALDAGGVEVGNGLLQTGLG